jgi:hypothetical protein
MPPQTSCSAVSRTGPHSWCCPASCWPDTLPGAHNRMLSIWFGQAPALLRKKANGLATNLCVHCWSTAPTCVLLASTDKNTSAPVTCPKKSSCDSLLLPRAGCSMSLMASSPGWAGGPAAACPLRQYRTVQLATPQPGPPHGIASHAAGRLPYKQNAASH